jgi:hypothetical protein
MTSSEAYEIVTKNLGERTGDYSLHIQAVKHLIDAGLAWKLGHKIAHEAELWINLGYLSAPKLPDLDAQQEVVAEAFGTDDVVEVRGIEYLIEVSSFDVALSMQKQNPDGFKRMIQKLGGTNG